MMQPNEFDGNAAFSGGGFMPSQTTQAPDPSPFSSSKNNDARCLIPVTVKQLKDLSKNGESGISIDGVEVNTVVLVGIVSNIENAVTECTFTVDDGTGLIECTKWVHEPVDTAEVEAISVGNYVRVYGQLKSIQSRRTLNTFSIRPLTDFNQITSHFLECIYVHLYNTKLRGMATQPQMVNTTVNNTNQFSGQHSSNEDQIPNIAGMIMKYMSQSPDLAIAEGVKLDTTTAQFLKIPLDKIREAILYLQAEGAIYKTGDDFDNHYQIP